MQVCLMLIYLKSFRRRHNSVCFQDNYKRREKGLRRLFYTAASAFCSTIKAGRKYKGFTTRTLTLSNHCEISIIFLQERKKVCDVCHKKSQLSLPVPPPLSLSLSLSLSLFIKESNLSTRNKPRRADERLSSRFAVDPRISFSRRAGGPRRLSRDHAYLGVLLSVFFPLRFPLPMRGES